MAAKTPIISFKNFSFQYRAQKKPTLQDINLDIYPGERVLIAGPSGSGKSTLAACINGLNPFSNPGECSGTLMVDGVDAPIAAFLTWRATWAPCCRIRTASSSA